jgi:hypothetical protein
LPLHTIAETQLLLRAQRLEKLGEGLLDAPEDVHVDAAAGGVLYTATRDGWLQRMRPGGGNGSSSWERWWFVGGTGLLGITPSADGTMLVCDADKVRPAVIRSWLPRPDRETHTHTHNR